jgi:hypothetical protein
MEWVSVLPNLSIGVVSVGALVYVCVQFLDRLDSRAIAHEQAMKEREDALRQVEREVRNEISTHLSASTVAITEASRVMERVINRLDTV